MRVISGSARGTKLNSIESMSTRPTLDRVKESLFSIVQNQIPEATILDLFSGSGAIAIEFLSRGAKRAYLCENNHMATKTIYENLSKTKLTDKAVIFGKDYKKCLEVVNKENLQFDIIYLDPPYKLDIAVDSVKRILTFKLLKEEGIIIIETDDETRELQELKETNVEIYDTRKYGRVNLIFLKQRNESKL